MWTDYSSKYQYSLETRIGGLHQNIDDEKGMGENMALKKKKQLEVTGIDLICSHKLNCFYLNTYE